MFSNYVKMDQIQDQFEDFLKVHGDDYAHEVSYHYKRNKGDLQKTERDVNDMACEFYGDNLIKCFEMMKKLKNFNDF